jgi:phosphoribosylformylglycinamidine synthase PurS subunit|tara:strand:+ start:684 stop:932 length:249 start_codon:yes stop_codon:yes gene_type:complete
MKRARVTTTTKGHTYDPQGAAITKAIKQLGIEHIKDVKAGRHFCLYLDENVSDDILKENITKAAEELLHNNIIEDYQIIYDD